VHKYQLDALKKRITVQTVLPEHLPFIYADIGLVERAIENLIDNALRYTGEGGNVNVTLVPDGSEVTFSVKDTGRGIPKTSLLSSTGSTGRRDMPRRPARAQGSASPLRSESLTFTEVPSRLKAN
jgi:signal transduction histidine kinase